MATRIQVRRDSTAAWAAADPVTPAQGELCLDTDTGELKIGDGTTTYADLEPFAPGGGGGDIDASAIISGLIDQDRLGTDSDGDGLKFLADDQTFKTPPTSSGDVSGPASSVDGRAVVFDGTTGKVIKSASAAPQLVGDAPTAHKTSHSTGGSDALAPSDIGAVPTSRTVNSKALSSDISLSATDVSADASGTAASAVSAHVADTDPHGDRAYADTLIAAADAMVFKGLIDATTNPNYPAADAGHTYRFSVAGKIGGASGTDVEVGDLAICLADGTAAGTQAAVGSSWGLIQTNLATLGSAAYSSASDFATAAQGTDSRTPTGSAGGVLSGTYPNPGFAADMATQSELDTHTSLSTTAHGGIVPSSRTVTAGTGLTGGGDLTANRTLTVAYGSTSGTAAQGNDARLSDQRNPVLRRLTFSNQAYNLATTPSPAATTSIFAQQTGTLSANRQLTLPAASAVSAGSVVVVNAGILGGYTLTVAPYNDDVVNGAGSVAITTSYGQMTFISNGVDAWVTPAASSSTNPQDGALVVATTVLGGI